jgi:hypothetical protein
LADALATIVGSRVNIVTACQSINDLKTPDDINLDGEATYRSISTNSQLKLVYGGADSDTAEWVAKLSGTIVKQVTSMEKVTVKSAGAEEWDLGRTIKPLEEALITENVALTLPPRVCVVFRPSELATVTFTAPVPVKDMSSLDKWLVTQSENEKNNIAKTNNNQNNAILEKVKKLEDDIEILSNLPLVSTEPTSIDVSDYEAVEDPMFNAESIVSTEPTSIDVSDYEAVEDPMFNAPSSVFTFIDPKVANQSDFNYRSTASFQSRTYDLYELSQKSDLSHEELSYIFAFSERQEKFRSLVDPDLFTLLLKKKSLVKKAKLIKKEIPATPPKYDLAEIAHRPTHTKEEPDCTKEEIDWVLRDAQRRKELGEISPELLALFQSKKPPYSTKPTIDDPVDIDDQSLYDFDVLSKKTPLTNDEICWLLSNTPRKKKFKIIVGQLIFNECLSRFREIRSHD